MWRREDPPLDRQTVDGIIRKLMSIDEKLDRPTLELLGDDGETETDTDT